MLEEEILGVGDWVWVCVGTYVLVLRLRERDYYLCFSSQKFNEYKSIGLRAMEYETKAKAEATIMSGT